MKLIELHEAGPMGGMNEHHLRVQRTARYFTDGDPASAEQVWFALHGYGQLATTFLTQLGTLGHDRRLIVAPEALSRFYHDQGRGPVGASWMTREDREHEISDYVVYLDALYREIASLVGPTTRFNLLGFSQGVATAGRWLDRGAASFQTACFWSGTLPPELDLEKQQPSLAGKRVALVLGSRDSFLQNDWLELESRRLMRVVGEVRTFAFDGGHRLDRVTLAEVAEYLEKQ